MKTRNDLISALEKFASLHRIVEFSVEFSVNYENRSMIYVPVSMHRRAELEAWLLDLGFKVNQAWPLAWRWCRGQASGQWPGEAWPDAGVVEVQVKYFSRKKAA